MFNKRGGRMSNYKVIVMDVDGTLTNNEKKITAKTKEALMKAQQQGMILVLASGRPTTGLVELAKELEMDQHHGLLVSYNGSKVIDFTTKEVLFDQPLSIDEIKSILKHLKQFDITPMIDDGTHLYVENTDGYRVDYETKGNNFILNQVENLESFVTFESSKILTSGIPEYMDEIFEEMKRPFEDNLSCMFTAPFYVEYTAKGIDKAKALDTVLTHLGYHRDEVIAFGDGHNDTSMIEYVGLGIAMDNAVQALKDISNFVTLSNEEDGIAYAINKFCKGVVLDEN